MDSAAPTAADIMVTVLREQVPGLSGEECTTLAAKILIGLVTHDPPIVHSYFRPAPVTRRRENRYQQCSVPGCKMRGAERYMAEHQAHDHIGCSCGFVGVSFGGHLRQLRRRGHSVDDHKETGVIHGS